MVLLVLEILFMGCGVYALVTGRLPALISGKKYRVAGQAARIIGLISVAPLVLAFPIGFALGFIGISPVIITIIEWLLLFAVAAAAQLLSRRMGQQVV